ncbi:homoserine dehydrogenase [Sporosarcina sp. P21c]|uniref:homoserine dehydrogenase n=1 Tax=Sporosarcina TaxID=1569 RepID=UPI000A1619CB|nr:MULTISPECIES: homoserine dehydrogenase [Sporosarcina]ARJ39078.1 homoserine dehydrogenase [Sporosarcina ureae]PIC65831.1 homoserine dehydrogenase [Sporosarcina sp. P16a]PIC81862.1 homoserine dehydrogenase [Sporosarcina sp. P1]PIC87542.1 homoserine dehydrogenase [Sporosarcina sp. P21c]PIC91436.1 homoserine dehydrogenase [Sporosarcina sp. P25]
MKNEKKEINIGLLGYGVVGSGVATILHNHQDDLRHKLGVPVSIKKVLVKNLDKKRNGVIPKEMFTTSLEEVLNDPEIDLIIEVTGGSSEAIRRSLEAGKGVVTANKDVMAESGPELLKLADENKCDLLYEASVGGGIPLIRTLEDGLASDRITALTGIVNGTTNFILTKMKHENKTYEDALAEATELGFAEADPSADVDGIDAARKMVILASLSFSTEVHLDDVFVRGMKEIADGDLQLAEQFGYTIKMTGSAKKDEEGIEVAVEPVFVHNSHPLATVNNEFNAVYVYSDSVGETMFYGPGAGSLPTATSVTGDVVAACRNILLGVNGKRMHSPQFERKVKTDNQKYARYFHRITVRDEVGVLTELTSIYSHHKASLATVVQDSDMHGEGADLIFITHKISRQQHLDILTDLKDTPAVIDISSHYRVEGE